MVHKRFESKLVRLDEHKYLLDLTKQGFVFHGYSGDHVTRIVACEGFCGDWAAYMETPFTKGDIPSFGQKIPQGVAEDLFPAWAQSNLQWRA